MLLLDEYIIIIVVRYNWRTRGKNKGETLLLRTYLEEKVISLSVLLFVQVPNYPIKDK